MITDPLPIPIIYYIPPEEKDAFIATKRSNGYIVRRVEYVAMRSLFEIEIVYCGIDLAD